MTIVAAPSNKTARKSAARFCLWIALPFLGLGYQIASKFFALTMPDGGGVASWFATAVNSPMFWVAAAFEIAALAAWLFVLSEFNLSEAFSVSAISYVLIVSAGWTVFHEPASLLQAVGGILIMLGVWLSVRHDVDVHSATHG
jgi:drug/metabolite transporter (DMT)-like permease